jgi:hypothetical protein
MHILKGKNMQKELTIRQAMLCLFDGKKICEEFSWAIGAKFKYIFLDDNKIMARISGGFQEYHFSTLQTYYLYEESNIDISVKMVPQGTKFSDISGD